MGFKFNGKHSERDFNFCFVTESMPIIAPKRQVAVQVQGRDGQYIFEDGYDNLIITLKCSLAGYQILDRRKKARDIAAWLAATGALIFDYESDIEYRVVKSTNDITATILGREYKDEFTIVFECEPHPQQTYYNDELSKAWEEQEFPWQYANIPWNGYSREFINVQSGQAMDLMNMGTYKALPVIVLVGQAVSVTFGGLTFKNLNGTVYIDCKNFVVYSLSGTTKVNRINDHSGNFIELLPGNNNFVVSGTITSLKIEFFYKNTYL